MSSFRNCVYIKKGLSKEYLNFKCFNNYGLMNSTTFVHLPKESWNFSLNLLSTLAKDCINCEALSFPLAFKISSISFMILKFLQHQANQWTYGGISNWSNYILWNFFETFFRILGNGMANIVDSRLSVVFGYKSAPVKHNNL